MALVLLGVRLDPLAYVRRIGEMSEDEIKKEAELETAAKFDDFTRRFMKEHGLKTREDLLAYLEEKKPDNKAT